MTQRMGRLRRWAPKVRTGALATKPVDTGPHLPSGDATARLGERTISKRFFDDYDRFYTTSETSTQPWRLNLRHEAIFAQHADALVGARVIDVASHDGRWSFAALQAGAAHVVGIEARQELVDEANANFEHYNVDKAQYTFVAADVFEALKSMRSSADVVLCLGFFYHTLRYNELLTLLRDTGARTILLDTMVDTSSGPYVRVLAEAIDRQGNAVADEFSWSNKVLVGRPTVQALETIATAHGYSIAGYSDWAGLLRDNPAADGIGDYRAGRRTTLRLEVQ